VFFREQASRQVHAGAGDVCVDVNAAGHDDHAAGIDRPGVRGNVRHDAAIIDTDVPDAPVDAVGRIVNGAAGDTKSHGRRT
jgi:hypothetical protein